jgi:hypothetical protein
LQPNANRKRMRRALLWTPCILASIIAMFAPETAGIASRLSSTQTVLLSHNYRIRIPLTWFIEYNDNAHFSAMSAPGIGRLGFQRYWHGEVPVSDMSFYPVPYPEKCFSKNLMLAGDTVLAKRSFSFGNESLNCWDLVEHTKFAGSRPTDPSMALIKCSSDTEHFHAYFDGWRGDTPTFYNVLQGLHDTR